MPRKLLILILLLLLSNCSACWDLHELGKSAVCTGAGIELSPEGKFIFTTQLIKPSAPTESGAQTSTATVLSITGSGVAEAARRTMLTLARLPEWHAVHSFIIGEELAREDLALLGDFLLRNRSIRPDTNLLLSNGCSPEDILSYPMPLSPYSGRGLETIMEHQEELSGVYVATNVHEFILRLCTPGIEPAVPQMAIKGGKMLIDGTAVFKGRRMVGAFDKTESRGYRWMQARSAHGGMIDFTFPSKPDQVISLELRQFASKMTPQLEKGELKMKIEVQADLIFFEQSKSGELLTLKHKGELERLAAQEIKRETTACIKKAQLLNSDVFGWGLLLHRREPQLWQELSSDWDIYFPLIESDITVRTEIANTMLSQKSFRFR